MNRQEALDKLDLYSELVLEHLQDLNPEAKLHYLMNLCKPTGHYCNNVLGQPGAPLTYQNLLYLTVNICLDIEENMKSLGTLGIPTKHLMLYNDLKPILSTLLTFR
jgi:hypothetical protein